MLASAITSEAVTSQDGTRIGYLRQGEGPGVVLVQGAMADGQAYRDLASALSASFTVISAERRGRGLSPRPYNCGHTIARDVEDLDAVMAATGATTLFGLSSGAVITLEATRTLPRVQSAIVYEPPFYSGGVDRAGIARLHAEIDRGDWASALVDSLLTAGTAPAILRRAPRRVARLLARLVLAIDSQKRGPSSALRDLLPGVRYDFHDVAGVDGRIDDFADITQPVLLLSGTKSPGSSIKQSTTCTPFSRNQTITNETGLDTTAHGTAATPPPSPRKSPTSFGKTHDAPDHINLYSSHVSELTHTLEQHSDDGVVPAGQVPELPGVSNPGSDFAFLVGKDGSYIVISQIDARPEGRILWGAAAGGLPP